MSLKASAHNGFEHTNVSIVSPCSGMIVCDSVTSRCVLVSVKKHFLACCSFCYVGMAVEVPPLYQLYQTLSITWKLSLRRISSFITRGPAPLPRKRQPATQSGRKGIRSVQTSVCVCVCMCDTFGNCGQHGCNERNFSLCVCVCTFMLFAVS